MKICSSCKVLKTAADFHKNQNYCKVCSGNKNRAYHTKHSETISNLKRHNRNEHWARTALQRAKARQCHPVEIDEAYVITLYNTQEGKCYWLAIDLLPHAPPRHAQKPSIDRIDNSLGYVEGNVVVASWFANAGRSSMSFEQMASFVNNVLNIRR